MKKLIAIAAMLSVMFFGFGTSHALIGVPDDVPGMDILVPWIYVSMPGFGNENTLITVTDVKAPNFPGNTTLHCVIYDIDSNPLHNWEVRLTPFDVYVTNGLEIINAMAPGMAAQLQIDIDNNGTPDHWAGYVLIEEVTWGITPFLLTGQNCNHLISHVYQVYLTAGMATAINGVSYEYWDGLSRLRQRGAIFPWRFFGDEAFSANALFVGKTTDTLPFFPPIGDATFFRLMPRYFILDDVGVNLLMIWTETFYTGIPPPGVIHCDFYDEEENVLSSNIPLVNELNILKVRDIIPAGLFSGVYPWGGWIDIRTPDVFANGWFTDANGNLIWDGAEREWLGYSWQRARGPANEAWEVVHPAHRETDPI